MTGRVEELARLVSGVGWAWRRRWAARRLAAMRSPEASRALAHAAASTGDDLEILAGEWAFPASSPQAVVDAVCQVWLADGRPLELGTLISRRGWVASAPARLRALTALYTGRTELLRSATPELARAMVEVADDEPGWLAESAADALRALARQDAREAVCALAVDGGSAAALAAAVRAGFAPDDQARRAVLLFLAGDFDRYAELDFDGSLLRSASTRVPAQVRVRLVRRASGAGRLDLFRALVGAGRRLDATEWEAAIAALVAAQQWDRLWELVREAPPVWGARMVIQLAGQGWVPPGGTERRSYDELLPPARWYEAAVWRDQPPAETVFHKPVTELNPNDIEGLQRPHEHRAARALAEFTVTVARRYYGRDIALAEAAGPGAGDSDIEISE